MPNKMNHCCWMPPPELRKTKALMQKRATSKRGEGGWAHARSAGAGEILCLHTPLPTPPNPSRIAALPGLPAQSPHPTSGFLCTA
eukprot:1809202-Alexandrium_andersonii.AAC.1